MKSSIIKDVIQGSDEWFELRSKRMTASHADAIGNCGKGLETYITSKMAEYYSTAEKVNYTNTDMERGNALEEKAGLVYSWEKSVEIKKVGFVIYNDYVGASPDLFVTDDGLVEIKCKKDTTHFKLLLDGKIESKYIWQMQAQMLICEKKWCDFVCYNPNFERNLFVERIFPDEKKVEKLLAGFKMGEELIKKIEAEIKGKN